MALLTPTNPNRVKRSKCNRERCANGAKCTLLHVTFPRTPVHNTSRNLPENTAIELTKVVCNSRPRHTPSTNLRRSNNLLQGLSFPALSLAYNIPGSLLAEETSVQNAGPSSRLPIIARLRRKQRGLSVTKCRYSFECCPKIWKLIDASEGNHKGDRICARKPNHQLTSGCNFLLQPL